jgi:hypothetical protein
MSIPLSQLVLVIDGVDSHPERSWAHFSERQARCADSQRYTLFIPISLLGITEEEVADYLAGMVSSDHWLNFLLQHL